MRTGRWARRAEFGPWQVSGNSAGLRASVLPWMDVVGQPMHTMQIAGFGTNIFDNMDLEALAEAAARENRWAFMPPPARSQSRAVPVRPSTRSPCSE